MFRHETVYAIIPLEEVYSLWHNVMNSFMRCPYINWITFKDNIYIVTNGNFLLDIEKVERLLYKWLIEYRVDTDTFEKEAKIPSIREMIRYTFKVTTQISTSRELNRVSPNSISEQSTRYVYEDGTICRSHWFTKKEADLYNKGKSYILDDGIKYYLNSCAYGFNDYKHLIEFYKLNRQDARGVLPIDTATVCAYTYSVEEWRHILDLRYYGITGKPHLNAKIAASMIREELIKLGYDFR